MIRLTLLFVLWLPSPILATADGDSKCDWLGVCDEQSMIK